MNKALQLAGLNLREYSFHLLWNGKAMLDWADTGLTDENLMNGEPHAIAVMLHLMGREAAAASDYYGYTPDEVPAEEELEKYLLRIGLPWERDAAMVAISAALQYGNSKDYDMKKDDNVDIDTLELKKN